MDPADATAACLATAALAFPILTLAFAQPDIGCMRRPGPGDVQA